MGTREDGWIILQMFIQTLPLKPAVTYYIHTETSHATYQHIICHSFWEYALRVFQPGGEVAVKLVIKHHEEIANSAWKMYYT